MTTPTRELGKPELRARLIRNIRMLEDVSFANGPFTRYEQERVERLADLRRRLSKLGESCRCWYGFDEAGTMEVMPDCPVHAGSAR